MSIAEWVGIGLASAMFLLMLLGWLGLYPKAVQKFLPKKVATNINVLAVLLTGCVGAIIYLAIAGREIPSALYMVSTMLLLFYFWTR